MDPLRRTAARLPDHPAIVGGAGSEGGRDAGWSYSELDRWTDEVSAWLGSRGVRPGDRVAMRLPPGPEAVVLLHAVARAGCVLVPLHPGWTETEAARGRAVAGPLGLHVGRADEVPGLDLEIEAGVAADPGAEPTDPAAPASGCEPDVSGVAAIVLTSGSTGDPHPVPISHGNLEASARATRDRLRLQPSDRWLTSLSMAHVGGLALVHRAAWIGSTLVTSPRFDAAEAAARIDAGEVTHLSLVPVMLARLLDERGERPPPASLRLVLVGGAATPPTLGDRALALGYPVALTYGLTEASSQVATAPPELTRRRPGTVGPPLPGLSVRIHDPNSAGVGEILVHGPTVVELAPDPVRSVRLDPEGWLHTGDLGRLDDGHLWVTGRRSDRIVTGGVTVEPGEVETVLQAHPGVEEVAVLGEPDQEWGERVVAVVVATPGARAPTLAELIAFTRGRIGAAKRPRELRIVESLPRNANGKIDRGALTAD